jgi:hypothetical protein
LLVIFIYSSAVRGLSVYDLERVLVHMTKRLPHMSEIECFSVCEEVDVSEVTFT